MTWVLKFVMKLSRKVYKHNGARKKALNCIVRQVQKGAFSDDIQNLKIHSSVPKVSKILQLYPFIDENGVLKVGGRLANTELPDDVKYPSILPNKHPLSSLILRPSHHELKHCGLNATLAHAPQHFWIICARQMTRQMIAECITCFRFNCRATRQLMGDLPKERITPSSPFSHVGVDLTGSILFKEQKTQLKCYVILFVCFVTKAIHLDLVRSLSTPDCLQAIRRFISRRGCPKQIYSDDGKNFIGSLNKLIK